MSVPQLNTHFLAFENPEYVDKDTPCIELEAVKSNNISFKLELLSGVDAISDLDDQIVEIS